MAGNDDQSLAAGNKVCSLNRSGRQRCILGYWLMITHRRPAGVAHERTTVVSNDEEAARPAGCLIDARSNPGLNIYTRELCGRALCTSICTP